MNFRYFTDALSPLPKLCVDGLLPGDGIHLSHWAGNRTPAHLKADTSTEIALNFVRDEAHRPVAPGVSLVSNNHFDTDGALSVWVALQGARSERYRSLLIAAAEAGDFSEFSSDDGVRVSLAIQGSDEDPWPMATGCDGDEARAYSVVLPQIERLLEDPGAFEAKWAAGWSRLVRCVESFDRGTSIAVNDPSGVLSTVVLDPTVAGLGRFRPTGVDPPSIAIGQRARGEWIAIATPRGDGFTWRVERAFHAWADTVERPRLARRPAAPAVAMLAELEANGHGTWRAGKGLLGPVLWFVDDRGAPAVSRLAPDEVSAVLRSVLVSPASSGAADQQRAAPE